MGIVHYGVKLLIAGDIELDGKRRLLTWGKAGLAAQLLVAPHHGAKDAVSHEFLEAVSPSAVVVFCANSAALPSEKLKRSTVWRRGPCS